MVSLTHTSPSALRGHQDRRHMSVIVAPSKRVLCRQAPCREWGLTGCLAVPPKATDSVARGVPHLLVKALPALEASLTNMRPTTPLVLDSSAF